jgi:xanthine dehydrogenase accessory factor
MTPATLAALVAARAAGQSVVLATRLADGAQMLLPDLDAPAAVQHAGDQALRTGRSSVEEIGSESWFLHVHTPPARLLVVGAVHIAQALAPMASVLGLSMTLIDPRPAFNSADRFAGVTQLLEWPDVAMRSLVLDSQTAVLVLAHDPKLDDPALDAALHSPAFYVGALGSRRSQAARMERLAALGHDADALARVRGPVGLALGAVTAPEIALSILADIVAVRRGAALAQRG